jgi:DNA-binding Xre family transcriptional regulator
VAVGNRQNRFLALLSDKEKAEGKRYKQREIVQLTGVRSQTITRLIRGDEGVLEGMNVRTLLSLARFLGCELSDLVPAQQEQPVV